MSDTKFELYYWVARFNDCENDEMYTKTFAEYNQTLQKLSIKDRQDAEIAFKQYTQKRLERVEKTMSILNDIIEEHCAIQKF